MVRNPGFRRVRQDGRHKCTIVDPGNALGFASAPLLPAYCRRQRRDIVGLRCNSFRRIFHSKWKSTAEHFCATVNRIKGNASILFITHALPKNLQVDELVRIGTDMLMTGNVPRERRFSSMKETEGVMPG